ncbi:MAG: hypothetical protein WCL22_04735 [bacterium]
MALSPSALLKGIVSRALPSPNPDTPQIDVPTRQGRYGDVKVESSWPTDHLQADEGAMNVATMLPGATTLQLGLSAAFSATAGAIVIGNTDPPGGRRIYPKALRLVQAVAPTSGTSLQYAIVLDNVSRQPTTVSNGSGGSGPGTPATVTAYKVPVSNTNADLNPTIAGIVFFPLSIAAGAPPTIPTQSQQARTIVGNGIIKNSIPVVLDQYILQFGSCDRGGTFQGAAALAKIVEHAPAVVIGPGEWMVIHLWSPSNVTAGNAFSDMALEWVEK